MVLLTAGALAFVAGLVIGSGHVPAERTLVERFASAWSRADYAAMYRDISDEARTQVDAEQFAEAYRAARSTATVVSLRPGRPAKVDDGAYEIPLVIRTRAFGAIRRPVVVPVAGDGDDARIAWARELVFPGLTPGAKLERETRLPERASLLARDRTVLARGPERTSDVPDVAINVVGRIGEPPPERAEELRRLGWPADAKVGLTGLERALDRELAGRPGGVLRAGSTVLARREPKAAAAVRTSISIPVERAAVAALGPRLGGVVAIAPRTGELLAFAGIAFSGLQPPGSTMKIITLTGGLEAGVTSLKSTYPVETFTTLSGVDLENANGESCGGSLTQSFAHSCNSVFAPMGAKLGAKRFVDVAERFGFNRAPDIVGAAVPTIPQPEEIGDDLAVGSSAIGQGRVQATALTMGTVATTIALRGRRPKLTLLFRRGGRPASTTRVTKTSVARTVEKLMLAVVREGTGGLAAIQGVKVAGKTGTAELETTKRCEPTEEDDPESCSEEADPTDTDAWFASYAPAGRPKVAVGVMLVRAGAGGDSAAPVARQVMLAALKR
jgi:cell division protein FtsI/penicillin-binding protein 2